MKVLLVDDYPDALEALSIYLNAMGFEVETAEDGMEGLGRAQASIPDVIVLDLQMPGLSGFEVAAALKRDTRTGAIPLIALSGHSRVAEQRDIAAVFASVLSKPCEPDYLIAEIRRVTRSRSLDA